MAKRRRRRCRRCARCPIASSIVCSPPSVCKAWPFGPPPLAASGLTDRWRGTARSTMRSMPECRRSPACLVAHRPWRNHDPSRVAVGHGNGVPKAIESNRSSVRRHLSARVHRHQQSPPSRFTHAGPQVPPTHASLRVTCGGRSAIRGPPLHSVAQPAPSLVSAHLVGPKK